MLSLCLRKRMSCASVCLLLSRASTLFSLRRWRQERMERTVTITERGSWKAEVNWSLFVVQKRSLGFFVVVVTQKFVITGTVPWKYSGKKCTTPQWNAGIDSFRQRVCTLYREGLHYKLIVSTSARLMESIITKVFGSSMLPQWLTCKLTVHARLTRVVSRPPVEKTLVFYKVLFWSQSAVMNSICESTCGAWARSLWGREPLTEVCRPFTKFTTS